MDRYDMALYDCTICMDGYYLKEGDACPDCGQGDEDFFTAEEKMAMEAETK